MAFTYILRCADDTLYVGHTENLASREQTPAAIAYCRPFKGLPYTARTVPPVKRHAALEKAVAPYAGEKGNLRFPIDRQIPYGLISRIVKFRATQSR
jgi:hypothetical protein